MILSAPGLPKACLYLTDIADSSQNINHEILSKPRDKLQTAKKSLQSHGELTFIGLKAKASMAAYLATTAIHGILEILPDGRNRLVN